MPTLRYVPPRAARRPQTTVVRPALRAVARPFVRTSSNPIITPTLPSLVDSGPYLDYNRALTVQGGVLITYKDIDERWRWTIWRVLAWTFATGLDTWLAFWQSPVQSTWLNVLCWLLAAGLNLSAVWKAVEVYRRIEVRPDCLILEGKEIFWRERMEGGWPELRPKDEETFILCGIYGTRFVEFGTLRRFDEFDRQPETFAAHLGSAIGQLWEAEGGKSLETIAYLTCMVGLTCLWFIELEAICDEPRPSVYQLRELAPGNAEEPFRALHGASRPNRYDSFLLMSAVAIL